MKWVSTIEVQSMVDDLSPLALAVLDQLGSADDYGFHSFKQLDRALPATRAALKAAMDELSEYDLVVFARGLMTDDGEVAGSGYARSDVGEGLHAIYAAMREAIEMIQLRAQTA